MNAAHYTEHKIAVDAPASQVYALIAGVENWPRVFPPTVHIEVLERDGGSERLQLWATANGEVKTWTSRRELDEAAGRVRFRQERSQHPVAAMGGTWVIEAVSDEQSLVTLEHDYAAVDDDPEHVKWIEQAIDRNTGAELAALKAAAELGAAAEELLLSFEDTIEFPGSPADAYEFIYDGQRWAERLPHVAQVKLTEDTPNVQVLEMDTRTKDGSVHTTKSVRVCLPDTAIVYKQLVVPALMTVHLGRWSFTAVPGGARLASRHTVVLKPEAIQAVLGADATVATARDFVRKALSGNSTATMNLAKAFAAERAESKAS